MARTTLVDYRTTTIMARGGWRIDGKRLQQARIARGWTVEELAQKAGFSERRVRDLEKGGDGRALQGTIACLARALDLQLSDLVRPPPEERRLEEPRATALQVAPLAAFYEPTRLETLVALERTLPAAPMLTSADGPIERLTAKRLQDVFSAYAARAGQRFYAVGDVVTDRGASAHECRLLGSRNGVASRFLLFVPIAGKDGLTITVHTRRPEDTLALQEKKGGQATVIVRVHLAPDDAVDLGFGFAFFQSATARPWAFVVEDILDGAPTPRAVHGDGPQRSVRTE